MSNRTRPSFFLFPRQLRVYFYTSSLEKLAQARYIFERSGFKLDHYKGKAEPYDEDYKRGTRGLLEKAIRQIRTEFGFRSAFFVEDTSLRIEALSGEMDTPGVTVKEWFAETSFEKLDGELKAGGNDRRATIKSDIALHLPTLESPVFFHGETTGLVAPTPPTFNLNSTYPWLTPKNFNGWFIPTGETKRLGELEPERSLDVDFRARALGQLLDRLYEYNSVAQLDRSAFHVRQTQQLAQSELPLGFRNRRVFAVVGHRCAGKTTFGDFARHEFGALHLEASLLIRELAMKDGESIEDSKDAKAYLGKHGYAVVAHEIVRILELRNAEPAVITGIRTVEELEYLVEKIPELEIVAINADLKTRFFRHIERGRDQGGHTINEFSKSDEEQATFGLLRVIDDVASASIQNDTPTLDAYLEKIRNCFSQAPISKSQVSSSAFEPLSMQSELVRSLAALELIGRPASCEEIHDATKKLGSSVPKYNNNRALKSVPELAQRLQERGELLRYALTYHGRSFLRVLRLLRRLRPG